MLAKADCLLSCGLLRDVCWKGGGVARNVSLGSVGLDSRSVI